MRAVAPFDADAYWTPLAVATFLTKGRYNSQKLSMVGPEEMCSALFGYLLVILECGGRRRCGEEVRVAMRWLCSST